MNKLIWIGIALVAMSCGGTTETSPSSLNLDRPVDIAFACYGGLRITNGAAATADQQILLTAQPLNACDIRSRPRDANDQQPVAPGQEEITGATLVPTAEYYGFILQSSRGTVAISHWQPKPSSSFMGGDVTVLDADPLTPGKNSISVGEDPIAIATDASGCKEITANAGSCDLSILDVTSVVDTDLTNVKVERQDVKNAAGQPIRSRPSAMVAQRSITDVGFACPATATGITYIAYPSCHAVAAVDVATGMIRASITYDALGNTTVHADGNLVCPDECGGDALVTAGPRPVAMALEEDPRSLRRALAIGSDNLGSVTVVDLGPDWLPLGSPQTYALENPDGKLGVTALAISPQIGMGGSGGVINDGTGPGGQAQYVYAVATDHTVRVVDILDIGKECDTQVDPRLIHDLRNVKQMSCFVVGDPGTPARRAGMTSPGIKLVGDGVPVSVAIVRADPLDGDARPSPYPTKLIGYFAIVTSSSGATFVVNIDDDDFGDVVDATNPIKTPLPLAIAHQLRDGLPSRTLTASTTGDTDGMPICNTVGPDPDATAGNSGGPRIVTAPTRTMPSGNIAAEKISNLPFIHQLTCNGSDDKKPISELGFAAPLAQRDLAYPDLRSLMADETWTLTYEGSLSADTSNVAIDGPAVRDGQLVVDGTGMHLVDPTRPFCDAGVEQYDVVQMRGCDPVNGNLDCPIGYSCYTHPESQVAGLGSCMLTSEADRLADACKNFLTSLRRYTVGRARSGEIVLLPRKRVLRTTPIDGCVDDNQCKALADYALTNASSSEPKDDTTAADTHKYSCAVDTLREPEVGYDGGALRRCISTCTTTADCNGGTVCEGGYCMEGVEPPQACVNSPQRFELRSHEAFTVIGSRSGYLHREIADAGGNCVVDPTASPLLVGRIPLDAPMCDPTTDPRTGKTAGGVFDANPCKVAVVQSEFEPSYVANSCAAASPTATLVERPTSGILFRNRGMTFTLVDPTYPGDAQCHGDRGGTLKNVPLVFTGVQLSFRQTGGFRSLTLPIAPSYPGRVVRGPGQSIWIMDEGDFLSNTVTLPSTRGKVYRVEASALNAINLLQ